MSKLDFSKLEKVALEKRNKQLSDAEEVIGMIREITDKFTELNIPSFVMETDEEEELEWLDGKIYYGDKVLAGQKMETRARMLKVLPNLIAEAEKHV